MESLNANEFQIEGRTRCGSLHGRILLVPVSEHFSGAVKMPTSRLYPPSFRRTGTIILSSRHVCDVRPGRAVLRRITEDEAAVEDASSHPRIARKPVHFLADTVQFVRTTPTAHSALSTNPMSEGQCVDVTAVTRSGIRQGLGHVGRRILVAATRQSSHRLTAVQTPSLSE